MTQRTVNVPGDKHEFDPERWTTAGQNGVQNGTQNGIKNGAQNGVQNVAHNGVGNTTTSRLPPRHPETGINVLVVGGGMGGLMTALECWRKGHNVVGILERNEGPVYSGV